MVHQPDAPDRQSISPRPTAGRKVLVVEDDPANRLLLSDVLTAHGFQVVCAETGELGFALASSQAPDLILLDRRLPDADGYSLCTRLRALLPSPATRILMMSGDDPSEAHSTSLAAGADDFLAKPLSLSELLTWLEHP